MKLENDIEILKKDIEGLLHAFNDKYPFLMVSAEATGTYMDTMVGKLPSFEVKIHITQ